MRLVATILLSLEITFESLIRFVDSSLRWRHNGCDNVSNHQPHDCLLNRLFRRRSKKTSTLRVTGLCVWNSPATGEFPAQMASNTENVSICWRHHVKSMTFFERPLYAIGNNIIIIAQCYTSPFYAVFCNEICLMKTRKFYKPTQVWSWDTGTTFAKPFYSACHESSAELLHLTAT